MISKIFWNS